MLDRLVKHHNYWIKILINLGCDIDLANDLVQDMYVKFHDADYIKYGEDDVNKYYVFKTLRSKYIQHIKDQNKLNTVPYSSYIEVEQSDYVDERDISEDKIINKIRDIIADWNSYDKQLFQVYFGVRLDKGSVNIKKGKSMRDISEGTGISLGSIFHSIKQFKRQFRDELQEDIQDYYNEDYDKI